MVQGGDPTGTGRGGTSIYGPKLYVTPPPPRISAKPHESWHSEDEFHPDLRFTGAGILAMANSGPNTNGASNLRYIFSLYDTQPPMRRLAILRLAGPDTVSTQL